MTGKVPLPGISFKTAPDKMQIELSPQQKKLVAAGITILAATVSIAALAIFLIYSARLFQVFSHVFLPLAVASVMAMILSPWYEWLRARLPMPVALILVFLSIIAPVGIVVALFGALIASQITELVDQLPVWWANMVTWFEEFRSRFDWTRNSELYDQVGSALNTPDSPLIAFGKYIASQLFRAGSNLIEGLVSLSGWVIVPVYLALFLMMPRIHPRSLTAEHFPFFKPATATDVIYLIQEFFNLVVVFFRGQILIALLQGILFATGFTLAGLQYGVVLGLMLGFLNIIPYLGSMMGLVIALPIAWFQTDGGATVLLIVIAVFCLVQLFEGYYLTPKIMGKATGLNPLAIIIGIFFWGTALNGILGMILAIPLTAFVVVFWRLAREKYIRQLF